MAGHVSPGRAVAVIRQQFPWAPFVRFTQQGPDAPVVKDMPLVGKRMIGAWIPVSENGVEFLGHATLHVESPRIRFVQTPHRITGMKPWEPILEVCRLN